jgi:DNA-binding CsgD family transcriptional regulator
MRSALQLRRNPSAAASVAAQPHTPRGRCLRLQSVVRSPYSQRKPVMSQRQADQKRPARLREGSGVAVDQMRRLTPAERRAVQGLVDGLRTWEIAASLGLSVHTIRTQLKRAMAKAGVHSQAALVARAFWSQQPLNSPNSSSAVGARPANTHIHHLGDARSKRGVSHRPKRRA